METSGDDQPPVAPEPAPEPTLTWAQDWQPEARSYLKRLAGHLEKREIGDHSVTVPIGKARLLVVAEEVELVNALAAGSEPDDRLSQLLLDGVGLRVKLLAAVKAIDAATSAEAGEAARESLRCDLEHLKELSSELQSLVSASSKAGDLATAKQAAEHRRRLLSVTDIAERAVPGVTSGTEGYGQLWTPAARQEYDPKAAAKARARHQAETKTRRQRGPSAKSVANAARLGLGAIALGSLLGLGIVYLRTRQPTLPPLSAADFANVPGIVQVIPRAPELLVVVADESWNAMSSADRVKTVEGVVARAEPIGYSLVEIRSPSRQELGMWRRRGQVKIAP